MWPFRRPPKPPEGTTPAPSNLHCSFCGKSQDEVRKLIAGPTVYICDECIDLCNDIIAEEIDQEDSLAPESRSSREPIFGTTLVCPLCRLPRIHADMLTVATDRLLCRTCAEAAGAALAAEEPPEDR